MRSVTVQRRPPDLEQLAAEEVVGYLEQVPDGASIPIKSSDELCKILELLVPRILAPSHPEWRKESLDGFFFSSATKRDARSMDLAGICILITDQTVTPFALGLSVSDAQRLASLHIRLGEPGGGVLGISGPECNSGAADMLLQELDARLDSVKWQYDVVFNPRMMGPARPND